jgi:hypothetical protein
MFRDPISNVRYTRSLFLELSYTDKSACIYTLKNRDHGQYISLYQRYMAMEDPLEHTFANTYFEDYDHWMMCASASWLKDEVARWRKELTLKLRAKALNRIRDIAADESNKASFSANRLLLEGGWMDKEERKQVGRPSKDAIREQADALFEAEKSYKDDLERLVQ